MMRLKVHYAQCYKLFLLKIHIMKEKIQSRIEYYEKENARLLYMILTLTKTKSKQTVYMVIKENESVIHELKHLLTL